MLRQQCDVLVLGGGPSGCAVAIAVAREGPSVVLLERTDYSSDRIGDTVAPPAAPWIARLGLIAAVHAVPRLVSPGVESLWGGAVPAEVDFLFNPYGPGLHVDRTKFDVALASQAEQCGVTVWRNARPCGYQRLASGWELTASVAGVQRTFVSPWIVDATGRSAWFVRRNGFAPRVIDRLIGLVARVELNHPTDKRLALEAVPDGWFYFAPLPGGRAVVALMTDNDLPTLSGGVNCFLQRQLSHSRLVAARFRALDRVRLRVINAATQYCSHVTGPNWIAVGDAAAAIDPLSGRGICLSLMSGFEAGRTILAANAGDGDALVRYQQMSDARVCKNLAEQSRLYGNVADWSDRPFWRRRVGQVALSAGL